jgi:hypothetical protein
MADQTQGLQGALFPWHVTDSTNAMRFAIKAMIDRVCTCTMVKVVSCTNADALAGVGTVVVQPQINMLDGVGTGLPHGQLHALPYMRYQGGANAIIMDPEPGDIGIAIFAQHDITKFKNTKSAANPGSRRKFSMSDGLYIGGFLNGTPNQFIQFITGTGINIQDINGNIISMQSGMTLVTTPIFKVTGQIEAEGQITARVGGASVTLGNHTHTQPNDSHGDGEEPTNAPTVGT